MRIDHPRGVACCAIDLAAVCVCVCVSVSVWFCPRSRVRACAVVACWLFVRAPSIRAGRLSRRVGLRGGGFVPQQLSLPAQHTASKTEREHLEHLECSLQPSPPGCFTEKLSEARGNERDRGRCGR